MIALAEAIELLCYPCFVLSVACLFGFLSLWLARLFLTLELDFEVSKVGSHYAFIGGLIKGYIRTPLISLRLACMFWLEVAGKENEPQ